MKGAGYIIAGVLATLCVLAPAVMAGGFGVGSGGLQGSGGSGAIGTGSTFGGCTVTATGLNCAGIDAGSLNVQANAAIAGALTVVTPSDITVGIASDINLGNTTNSRVRGGSAYLRLDDSVGFQGFYTGSTLTLDGNATFSNTAGSTIVSGDATSPVEPAFRITPQDAEPTGANVVGDMYVTTAGVLKICTVAGTPGTWVSVGAQ